MVKGCKASMVGVIHSLCHRHLRACAKRQLKNGMGEEEVEILGKMFDNKDALVTIDNEDEYREAAANIDPRAFKKDTYFEELVDKIWHAVILPRLEARGAIKLKNTTNNVGN